MPKTAKDIKTPKTTKVVRASKRELTAAEIKKPGRKPKAQTLEKSLSQKVDSAKKSGRNSKANDSKAEINLTQTAAPAKTAKVKAGNPSLITKVLKYRPSRTTYLVLVLLVLALAAYYKKEWFVAATVNGSPISNLEVIDRMNQQHRSQVLNQMVNEKILENEASKKGITVSSQDINTKIAELEKSVGGPETLDALLSQQGQSLDGLREQIRIQLMIEKLYESEASISAEEVSKFITENKEQLTSTDSAEQSKEATEILKQQKLSNIFSEKFQQLKQDAKVEIFK